MKKRLLSVLAAIFLLLPPSALAQGNISEPSPGAAPDVTEESTESYDDYLSGKHAKNRPDHTVKLDMKSVNSQTGELVKKPDSKGENTAVLIEENSRLTWQADVPEEGFYNIKLEYMTVPGKGVDMELGIHINHKLPFASAAAVRLFRVWKDSKEKTFSDSSGNEYRPVQIEAHEWSEVILSAADEYRDSAYSFYFEAGTNYISLSGVRESVIIGRISLCQEENPPAYKEYIEERQKAGYEPKQMNISPIRIEGEDAVYKSSPTLYSISDYSSSFTSPYDVKKSLQNTIGGENWASAGQWLEWDFEVKESGFYQFYGRVKQNYKSGSYSVRRITIDGKVPFSEAASMRFPYELGWKVQSLGDEKPQLIWLDSGKHTLRMEAVFGDFAEICSEVETSIEEMNVLYRKIMMITGSSPDALRDYKLERLLPESPKAFKTLSARFKHIVERLTDLTGGKGAETAAMEKMALQLSDFAKDVETIPSRLKAYNDNISSIASWLINAGKQPLLVDYFEFAPLGHSLPKANLPWYKEFINEIKRFYYSFVEDYDNIQSASESKEEPVTLWLGVGRDQAIAMQSIISNHFSTQYGIPVNLRLIDMNVLMRAVAGGTGPDLAMYQDQTTAINYALRNAAYDLNQFPDIEEITRRFPAEAVLPFRLGDGLYALPEQINYNVLFYRTDVLKELGINPPKTWDEMYNALTVMQKHKLELGVISSFTTATNTAISPLFLSFLYQNGGKVYNEKGSESLLKNKAGILAFTKYCELYTKYGLSLKIDMLTRFRTGEAPMVINNFSFGNELSVSAPELSGLWKMALLPGTQSEGKINHATTMTVTGTVMFSNARNKANTWAFIKWWTGQDAQVEYSRQIESTLGRSGRWTSANLQALDNSAWSREELALLKSQLEYAKALPEVAGGYYTGRSINNAIRTAVNHKSNAKETLYEYVKDINKEISLKRKELGLN